MRLITLLVLFSTNIFAFETLTGRGQANCVQHESEQLCSSAAQSAALSMLSAQIFSFIETRNTLSRTKINAQTESLFQSKVRMESSVPLLGATVKCEPVNSKKVIACSASLEQTSAQKTYTIKHNSIVDAINNAYISYLEGDNKHLATLEKITNYFSELEMISAVLSVLGIEQLAKPIVSYQKIVDAHLAHYKNGLTPLAAAQLIATTLPNNGSYLIHVPTHTNGEIHQSTGVSFYGALKKMLTTVSTEQAAGYIASAMIDDNGEMLFTVKSPKSNEIVYSKLLKLQTTEQTNSKGIAHVDSFFSERIPQSASFQSRLRTNKGERGLLFSEGEQVVIEALLSDPGCFYVIVKSNSTSNKFNYLLQLHDGPLEVQSAVKCINSEQAGLWITLGAFDVAPPFGTEELTLIASPSRRTLNVPNNVTNDGSGYLMVLEDPIEITRGLKRVMSQTKSNTVIAQSVLKLQTVP